jgi:lysozyme
MILKSPLCVDTSHWKIVPDFALVSPRPALVITKATEHVTFVDPTFIRYYTDILSDGIKRGCFHFFRKFYDAIAQARHFCETIKPYVLDDDVLVLDFEEGGETATQLIVFLKYVRMSYPRNLIVNYSRKNLFDAVPATETQKEELRKYPTWTAGYPDDPDPYNNVPSFYVPDPTKWGPVWLWQYTSHGTVTGIDGSVDCNWMHPDLIARLGVSQPPTEGETMAQIIRGTALGNVTRRQTAGGAGFVPARYLVTGDRIEADRHEYQWLHLTKINDAAVSGDEWVSAGTLQQYISWQLVDVPTEPEPPTDPDTVSVDIEADIVATFNGAQYHGVIAFGNVQLLKVA